MKSALCLLGAALALALAIPNAACGSDDDSKFDDNGKSSGGASGDGGTSGIGSSGTSGASGGPGGLEDGGACAAGNADGARAPAYLFFILDQSKSMGTPVKDKRWTPVTQALTAFLNDPASTGITASLELFPAKSGDECTPGAYATTEATMNVPMTPITPANVSKFTSAWPADATIINTPTKAVVQAIGPIASKWADDHKDGKTAIVMLTDGYPQGCSDNNIDNVATEIKKFSDKVPLYVIGVSDVKENLADLKKLADAGKTQLTLVDTSNPANTQKQFLDRINQIRTTTQSCDVTIPPPPAGLTLDLNKLNVVFTQSDGTKEALAYDENCSTGSRKAWHFDNPTTPTKITLCTMTCDVFEADPRSKVTVEFGCQRVDVVK